MCRCHPPMVWMTVLSLSSSSPRAISSVFIHRIILQRDSGRPAAQPTDTFAGGRDSLPAFSGALQRAMVKKMRERDSCNGRPSEAEDEEEEGRSTQNVTPLLLSHMIHGGWRGEFWEERYTAWEKWMLSNVECCCRDWWRNDANENAPTVTATEELMGPLHMKTECWMPATQMGGWWSSRQPHSHIHASASAHDCANLCNLADRGGGDAKVSVADFIQQQMIQHWHLA